MSGWANSCVTGPSEPRNTHPERGALPLCVRVTVWFILQNFISDARKQTNKQKKEKKKIISDISTVAVACWMPCRCNNRCMMNILQLIVNICPSSPGQILKHSVSSHIEIQVSGFLMRVLVRWERRSDSFISHSDKVIYNCDWDQYCCPALFFRAGALHVQSQTTEAVFVFCVFV